MTRTVDDFQIFVKPAGSSCNLACRYCYYLDKGDLFPPAPPPIMAEPLLENYIRQHIDAQPSEIIYFSWHGGEPALLGTEYFHRVVQLQEKHCPPHKQVRNGIQTNGTLLDDNWARFLAEHRFTVGLSLDGPAEIHDRYRTTRQGGGSHQAVMRGYGCLVEHGVPVDVLCVVSDYNVMFPLQVYRFFTDLGVKHLSFLPLVERLQGGVSDRTVHPEAFGAFLCTVFDEWLAKDIGTIKIQIFEEAARTAFGQDHSLCLFRPTCGDVPVLEHNGDLFACDHFVTPEWRIGNIGKTPLAGLLASDRLAAFGRAKSDSLPRRCRSCEVLAMCNGECPRNRFVEQTGEEGRHNYLCAGYRLFFTHCRPFIEAVARQWRTGGNSPRPGKSLRSRKKKRRRP